MPAPTSTRTAWKGAISFGLVHIPIALHSATQDIRPKLHLIDRKTNAPVGHKNYDKSTGKEVANEDIVKGLETDKGHFIALTKEEIAEALPRTTGTIGIEQFVQRDEIPLSYYEKPYYVTPEAKGGKPYALLREVLRRTNRVGLGKIVMSNRQHLAIVAPEGDALVLLLLRWEAEVRETAGLPLPGKDDKVTERELKMAETLVKELDAPWRPEQYHDEYVEKLEQVIEAKKKAGKEQTLTGILADEIVPETGAEIVDLTELLKRSLRGGEGRAPAARSSAPKPSSSRSTTKSHEAANDSDAGAPRRAAAKAHASANDDRARKPAKKRTSSAKTASRKRA